MKRLLLLTAILLTACGPSQKEKEEIAIITCNIMGESRNMDGAVRIKEINAAREKMGEDSFLGSDDAIKQSFKYGLCRELVLNDHDYIDKLTAALEIELARLKAEEEEREKREESARIAREKREESARIAREKREESARIAREKREEPARIAREKREETARIESELALAAGAKIKELVKKLLSEGKEVSLHTNGQISMIRPNKGSSLNGNVERFYKNGQMMFKAPYQNGKKEGISEYYDYDGNLTSKKCFKDGSEISLEKCK
jgi:hypothetical protein